MTRLPPAICDFHVHLFPDRLFEAIWDYFSKGYQWDVIHRLYWRDAIGYLRERNVGPIVFSNYAHRPGIAEQLTYWNHEVLDKVEDIYCFSAFHPDDDNALDYARKAIAHPRVLGFKLQLLVQQIAPHDERFFGLYDLVMESGKRLLLHVGTGPVGNPYVGLDHFARLMERYPDLPVNVAHMGGLEFQGFFSLLDQHPHLVFDTSFAYLKKLGLTCDVSPKLLEEKKERILYGSDFPNLILPREDEIEYLLGLNLSEQFYKKVFFENGMRLIRSHSG